MCRLLTATLVLLAAGSDIAADDLHPAVAAIAAYWYEVKSDEGGFRAAFPVKPEDDTESENTPAGKIPVHYWICETNNGKAAFFILATDFRKPLVQFSTPQHVLDEARNGSVQFLGKGTLRKEEEIKFGKHPARMLVVDGMIDDKPAVSRQRLVLVGSRLYQQILIYEKGAPVSDAEIKKFFDSFELLEK